MPTIDRGAVGNGANESPKRKRVPSLPGQLSIDTSGSGSEFGVNPDVCDSPRSKVAERLGQLDLRPDGEDMPRKRSRTRRWGSGIDSNNEMAMQQTPVVVKTDPTDLRHEIQDRHLEIAETPDCGREAAKSPTLSPMVTIPITGREATLASSFQLKSSPRRSPKRLRSPPPPTPTPPNDSVTPSPPPNSQITSSQDSQGTPNPSALTWQDAEITGHEIDITSGDDGEGINGVGFHPTPMIAYARSQKRQQQVNDWKAREARDARQRRFQKRQQGGACGTDAQGTGDDQGRRVVRFADVS